MWRHPALRPLSRDHFAALLLIRDVRWAAASGDAGLQLRAAAELAKAWSAEIAAHFQAEDDHLRPHLTANEVERIDHDHAELRARFAALLAGDPPQPADAQAAAELLHEHVRWEESELYAAVQARLPADEMAKLAAALESADDTPAA